MGRVRGGSAHGSRAAHRQPGQTKELIGNSGERRRGKQRAWQLVPGACRSSGAAGPRRGLLQPAIAGCCVCTRHHQFSVPSVRRPHRHKLQTRIHPVRVYSSTSTYLAGHVEWPGSAVQHLQQHEHKSHYQCSSWNEIDIEASCVMRMIHVSPARPAHVEIPREELPLRPRHRMASRLAASRHRG